MDRSRSFLPKELTSHQILLIILLAGLILRLLGLINIPLAADFAVHWKKARDLLLFNTNPFIGPNASINPHFYLGPFYYYLLTVIYLFGRGNYLSAIIFFSIFNTFSIFLLYKICLHWFSKRLSLQITALYSISHFIIISQNYPWNPHLLILFNLLAIYSLIKIRENKLFFLPILFLLMALMLQLHGTSLLLFPFYLLFLPYRKLKIQDFVIGLLIFFIVFLPWLTGNLLCQNCQVKELFNTIWQTKKENCDFVRWFYNHGHGESCFQFIRNPLFILKTFSLSLFSTKNIFGLLASLIILLWFIFKAEVPFKKFFLGWFFIPTIIYLFYSSNVYQHYFLIFIPLPFIFYVVFLNYLEKKRFWGKIISRVLFYGVIIVNIFYYLLSLGQIRY